MKYQLLISDESRLDILSAYTWYERRQPGLGEEFELRLESALETIQSNPLLFQKRYKNLHICFLKKFPFVVHYLIENDVIRVFGIFHTSRDPNQWLIRLKSRDK